VSGTLRVCMLTTGFPRWRGDLFGSFVFELARALVARGTEVHVVAPHEHGLPRHESLDGVLIHRFRYCVPTRWQRVAYGGGIPTNMRTSRLARLQVPLFLMGFAWRALWVTRRCDVVHCHWSISGLVGFLATRLWRRPLLLTVRGSDVHLLDSPAMLWLHRHIYGWMHHIIAVSTDIAGKLGGMGVDPARVHRAFNGVDARFQPGDSADARGRTGLPADRFIVLFVGLLVPVKGLDVLVQSLPGLDAPELLCVLVGEGDSRAELERQAEELGVSRQLRFVGRQPSSEIQTWINAADVLVLPSRSEGRPNVVLEAQACGVPVIATRVGGTPELVQHEQTGLLMDRDDPIALAGSLRRLMEDADLRRRLGRAGRQSIIDQGLTWEANAEQMLQLYGAALERRPG
jgi:glycosyltransferase involved in cell wall biosynthesis